MEWKDKSWDKKNISKYNLAVQVSKAHIVLANSDAKTNKILALAKVSYIWNNVFVVDKFLQTIQTSGIPISKKYNKVSFCIENNNFSLMPESLAYPENLQDILSVNCFITIKDFVQKDVFKREQIAIIYSLNLNLKNWIKTHFPSAPIKHSTYYLLENFVHKINQSKTAILAYLQADLLYILCLKDGKINLLNTFYCTNSADLLYYTTATIDALNIPNDTFDLYLSGEISKTGETIDLLKRYFTKIFFIENSIDSNLPALINGKENHYYSLIINQIICE